MDDAVGEAFDRWPSCSAWLAGRPCAGAAGGGRPSGTRLAAPPLLGRAGCDFSFSGLKTAFAQLVAAYPPGPLPAQDAADLAAGFQEAVSEVMADRAPTRWR